MSARRQRAQAGRAGYALLARDGRELLFPAGVVAPLNRRLETANATVRGHRTLTGDYLSNASPRRSGRACVHRPLLDQLHESQVDEPEYRFAGAYHLPQVEQHAQWRVTRD